VTTSATPMSAPSVYYPHPPTNTPAVRSITDGNDDVTDNMREMSLAERITKGFACSNIGPNPHDEQERTLQSLVPAQRDSLDSLSAHQPLSQTVRQELSPPVQALHREPTFEHSTWAVVAEEDVTLALKRMAQSARDEHQKDPSKSVEHFYSERLAKLIGTAELEFDASYLKK